MKTAFHYFSLTIFFMVISVLPLHAQRSDRVIVDKFEETMKALTKLSDSAKTVQDCADLNASIEELQKEFASHKDLLDKSLYPDNYETMVTNLKGRLMVRQKDLGVIESQFSRIVELEAQVRELSGKVDSLGKQNDKLLSDAKRFESSLKENQSLYDSLKNVIKTLQQNLQQRDDMIFALLDSLFLQYDKNVASLNDVEKQGMYGKLERKNVLTNIKKSISDNLQFIQTTSLTPADYAQLAQQHNKFKSQWKGVGSKLANIYLSGKQKKNEVAAIDSMLATWSTKVEQGTWKAIASLFEKNGITLKSFATGAEFSANFSEFLDTETKNVRQEAKDVRLKRYNNFEENIWNAQLDKQWLPVLVESGSLTADQKTDIEKKVDAWRSSVVPTSWAVYVIVGLLIVIVLWIVSRFLKKKPA